MLTREHTIGLVLPLTAALIAPMAFNGVRIDAIPRPAYALIAGAITAAAVYLGMNFIDEDSPLNKAILVGLLVAELVLFETESELPSMTTICLLLFLYFHNVEKLGTSSREYY